MYNPTVQTVEGPLVPLADSAASSGPRDLHIGPRCWGSCRRRGDATERMFVCTELVKMFSTWEEIDGKREPRASRRGGDRRRAVLASFKQLQIDFQAKHICIRKTVLWAIRVSCGMCALNRWVIFLELSCRNFSPLNWGSWALFSLLFFLFLFIRRRKNYPALFDRFSAWRMNQKYNMKSTDSQHKLGNSFTDKSIWHIWKSSRGRRKLSLLQRRLSLQTLQNWKKSLGEKSALGHNKPNKHVHNRVFIQSYDFQIYDQNPDVGAEDCQVALSFSLPLSLRGCDLPEWALSPHPLGCMKNSPGLPIRVSLNQGAGVTAATRMTLLSLGI